MKIFLGIGAVHNRYEVQVKSGYGRGEVLLKNTETGKDKTIAIPFLEVGLEDVKEDEDELKILRQECHKMLDMLFDQAADRPDMTE